jgi:hypothetical protein
MSWASGRQTTRIEDEAYSLLGIFEVHMPLLYGEESNAFTRLQKEIIGQSSDQSIFAWDWVFNDRYGGCFQSGPGYLATSLANFVKPGTYAPMPRSIAQKSFNVSRRGLEITTDVVYNVVEGLYDTKRVDVYAILHCFDTQRCTRRLALELKPWNHPDPKLATEFTIRWGVSLEAALSEKIKVVRSITILNDPEFADDYDPSMDLRVRCFLAYGWSSMSSVAGVQTGSEELSFDVTRWFPADSWDSRRSIFTVRESFKHMYGSACGFIGKLCYTPCNRRALSYIPSEVNVNVHLYNDGRGGVEARFYLETETASVESAWKALRTYRHDFYAPRETMESEPHNPKVGRWDVRLLYIKLSINDPYGTLGIAVLPPRSLKRVKENLLVIGTCTNRLSPFTWMRDARLRKAHQQIRNSVEYHNEDESCKAPKVDAPRLTVKSVYGDRKRWRQSRAVEIMNSRF